MGNGLSLSLATSTEGGVSSRDPGAAMARGDVTAETRAYLSGVFVCVLCVLGCARGN